MRYERVCIESLGHVLPPDVVTSEAMEEVFGDTLRRIGLGRGQIEKLAGVRERRFWKPGTTPSSVSAIAAERALAKAGLAPGEVQVLINASVSRDYLEPATAAMVAGRLGVGHECLTFDVGNACVGFLNGMMVLANMIELGQVDNGVVVCAETIRDGVEATLRRLADPGATMQTFRDNFASLTLGSGAVAMVMTSADRSRTGHRFTGSVGRGAPEHNTLCLAQYTEMVADSHGLLVHGVGLAAETWPVAVEAFGWEPGTVDRVVGHQVSLAHFSSVFKSIGEPLEKAILTLPYLGNCGPASLPLTLAIGEAQGAILPGQTLALFAVGSGLGCIIQEVRW